MRSALVLSLFATAWSQPTPSVSGEDSLEQNYLDYAPSDASGEASASGEGSVSGEGSAEASAELGYVGNYDEQAEQDAAEASSEFSYTDQEVLSPGQVPGQPIFPSVATGPGFPVVINPGFPVSTGPVFQPSGPVYQPSGPVYQPTEISPAGTCPPDAGYLWCAAKKKCLRAWEEPCPEFGTIAQSSAPRSSSGSGLYRDPRTGLYTPSTSTAAPYVPPATTYVPPTTTYVPPTTTYVPPTTTYIPPTTTYVPPATTYVPTTTFTAPSAISSSSAGSLPGYVPRLYTPKDTIATVPAPVVYANAATSSFPSVGTTAPLPAFPPIVSTPVITPVYRPATPFFGATTILPPIPVATTLPLAPVTTFPRAPVTTFPPVTGCVCGQSCIMASGSLGVCQTDRRTCAINIVAPNCGVFA